MLRVCDEVIEGVHPRQLRGAWAQFIDARTWSHFATLTTRGVMSAETVLKELDQSYLRRLTRVAKQRVGALVVVEGLPHRDRIHLHALLSGAESLQPLQLQRKWHLGNAKVEVYDVRRRAALYLMKGLRVDAGVVELFHCPDISILPKSARRRS